jgi:hypothetical protein
MRPPRFVTGSVSSDEVVRGRRLRGSISGQARRKLFRAGAERRNAHGQRDVGITEAKHLQGLGCGGRPPVGQDIRHGAQEPVGVALRHDRWGGAPFRFVACWNLCVAGRRAHALVPSWFPRCSPARSVWPIMRQRFVKGCSELRTRHASRLACVQVTSSEIHAAKRRHAGYGSRPSPFDFMQETIG